MCIGMSMIPVHAADYHEPVSADPIDSMFENLEDSDSVLHLPQGGYLHGTCEVYDASSPDTLIATYDSQNNPASITVRQAKKEMKASRSSGISTYGANPPGTDTLLVLKYGADYTSEPFSASGWRFGGKQFKAASGSGGDYLRWTSYVDGGRVGNYNEAYATKNSGTIQGTALEAGVSVWNSEGNLGQIYYTYNPLAGTYYNVANVNG